MSTHPLRLRPLTVRLARTSFCLHRHVPLGVTALTCLFLAQSQAHAAAPTISVAGAPLSYSTGPNTSQTITATVSDADGNANLNSTWLIINTGNNSSWAPAVCGVYDAIYNKIYMRSEDGSTWLGGVTPGASTVLSSSLGSIDCQATTVTRSGNNLVIAWKVKAGAALDGNNGIWVYADDQNNNNTGNPFTNVGSWAVTGLAPQIVPQSPTIALNTSINQERTVSVTYRDPDGSWSQESLWVNVNDVNSTGGALCGIYDARSNLLYLRNDADNGNVNAVGVTPGSTSTPTLTNAQGTLNCKDTTVTRIPGSTDIIVNWKFTPKAGLAGANNVYAFSADRGNRNSGLPMVSAGYTWQVTTSAPMTITGTAGNAQTTLNWSSVTGATGYHVLRATSSGGPYTQITSTPLASNATSYPDTTAANGTTYYYVVYPTLSSGRGPDSNELSLKPLAAPAAPTGLTKRIGNSHVLLSWGAVTGATGYRIYRSETSNTYSSTPLATVGAVTSYDDTAAANGATYYYKVSAINANNTEGAKSSEVSAVPTPWVAITLTGSGGNGQASLSWTPAQGATSYKVYQASASGPVLLDTVIPTIDTTTTPPSYKGTKYTVSGLTNGSTYGFSVVGYNGGVIVTDPNAPSISVLIGGPLGVDGYYDGASDVTWDWSEETPVDYQESGSGQHFTTIPIAGPESLIIQRLDHVSAYGPGHSTMLRRAQSRKVINWSWVTSDESAHPAPSVEPEFAYSWISMAETYNALIGDLAGFRLQPRCEYNNQLDPTGSTSKEFGGGDSNGSGYKKTDDDWTPAFVATRVHKIFTTKQRISLEATTNADTSNASGATESHLSTFGRFQVALTDPQPYTGP